MEALPASFESCLKAEQLGWHSGNTSDVAESATVSAPLRYGEGICAERDYKIARRVWGTYGAASAGHRTSIGRIERFTDGVRDRA